MYCQKEKSLKIESEVPISILSFIVNNQKEEIQKINLFQSKNEKENKSKLAPGTSGNFQILLDASNSQVDIKYNIFSVEENNKPHNLIFIYQEKEYDSFKQMEEILSGTIGANEEQRTRTF